MSVIEASIVIHVPDGANVQAYINSLSTTISGINGKPTRINVVQADDPLSTSPIKGYLHDEERE